MQTTAFQHRFTVGLADTDAAGVLFYGHLFRHAHDAFEAFMARCGHPVPEIVAAGEWGLPIAHAKADYLRPMRHGEAITVELTVRELGEHSFRLGYRFRGPGGTLRARAETVHVATGRADGATRPLPEPLRTSLTGAPGTGPTPSER